ncbi:LysR family transcriptional regulator [Streptomyces mobaraensis NBRC 13819 = DSM 40847]|uniref:LysR family transcriptional regulator n=1 Tax=Streptomyces mobaraensis (strain ATCC 29032 / DSM 40847 / JCM 4168 / NBRC 13819 / NCIMB 11159 / IPCR 16-22) TaxID=1223523 RepID=M3BP74_STRM1|nr:LysR family transcriptional regulator [Streptomyces mobaraensis]EMF01435.1 LysR family transcriptional regulator [Streptomyces mobaraensis NBRC 13819 = DSM 40847]QTT76768.1 LysR family transcriptional regulator [Streptomyces mobaraensis NBRC 13819 = DSM 40847]
MEIFHLRYFVAVAENLSFSRAARQLHMATSPLSRRIRDLERELGRRLFDRDSHHVALTPAGAALLPAAKDVLGRFDDLPWRLRQALGPERRTAYVGVVPALHPLLRERLARLETRCADAYDVKRWPGNSGNLVAAVQRGDLAMALVHLPVHAEGIEVLELLHEPLGALLPAAEFGGRGSVSLSELTDHTYVTSAPGTLPTYFDQLKVRLKAAGIHREINLEIGDYASVREIVANGSVFGITLLSAGSRGEGKDTSVVLPFRDFSPALATGLVWRRDRARPDGDLHTLISAAGEEFAAPLDEPPDEPFDAPLDTSGGAPGNAPGDAPEAPPHPPRDLG